MVGPLAEMRDTEWAAVLVGRSFVLSEEFEVPVGQPNEVHVG